MKLLTVCSPLVLVFLLSGCGYTVNKFDKADYLGYQVVDPLPSKDVLREPTTAEKRRILRSLPLQSANVSVSQMDKNGTIKYLDGSLSSEAGAYEVVMDFLKYRVEPVKDPDSLQIGNMKVGVGLRIRAQVVSKKENLNLGSLLSIGGEAQSNNLKGYISVDVIGIDSKDVTNLIPLTAEIDQTSIQSALQALASIKSKIWDDSVELTPHIVAIKQTEPKNETKIRNIISVARVYSFGADSNTVQIREFVKPNGQMDLGRKMQLLNWIKANINVGYTEFLNGETWAKEREKFVQERLKKKEEQHGNDDTDPGTTAPPGDSGPD